MTAYVLPLLATVAAAGLTYAFCIRPMRRGGSCHTSPSAASDTPTELDTEIKRLREEVQLLRQEADPARCRTVPTDKDYPR